MSRPLARTTYLKIMMRDMMMVMPRRAFLLAAPAALITACSGAGNGGKAFADTAVTDFSGSEWRTLTEEEWKQRLDPLAFRVLREEATERAFTSPLNDEKRKEWKVWLAYWGRAPHAPALAQIHRQYYAEIETAVAEDMEDIHPDPHMAAAAIIAAVDGIGTRATLEPDLWPEARQVALLDQLISPIIASFSPQPTSP